jgi:hypothetical protein
MYSIKVDATTGAIQQATNSDLAQDGAIEITAEQYAALTAAGLDHKRWQDGALVDYTPPPPPVIIPPLEPYQFMQVVAAVFAPTDPLDPLSGLKTIVATAITDAAEKYRALSMLIAPPGGRYYITDPLFSNEQLLAATGKTADDIEAMWAQGLALT